MHPLFLLRRLQQVLSFNVCSENHLSTMRLPRSPADAAMLLTLLFPLLSAADGSFDCHNIRKDKVPFDFSSLAGPRSVMVSDPSKSATFLNTTYTIDICRPLKRASDIPKDHQCPHGTRGECKLLAGCGCILTKSSLCNRTHCRKRWFRRPIRRCLPYCGPVN